MTARSGQGLDGAGRCCQVGHVDTVVEAMVGKCLVGVVREHRPHLIFRVALEEANCRRWSAEPAQGPVHQWKVRRSHQVSNRWLWGRLTAADTRLFAGRRVQPTRIAQTTMVSVVSGHQVVSLVRRRRWTMGSRRDTVLVRSRQTVVSDETTSLLAWMAAHGKSLPRV